MYNVAKTPLAQAFTSSFSLTLGMTACNQLHFLGNVFNIFAALPAAL